MDKVVEWITQRAGHALGLALLGLVLLLTVNFVRYPQGFSFAGLSFGPKISIGLPENSVIAVLGECPNGAWEKVEEAAGRFLVGANASAIGGRPNFEVGSVVGSHIKALQVANLPAHVHRGTSDGGREISPENWRIVGKAGGAYYANHVIGFDPNNSGAHTPSPGTSPGMSHSHTFSTSESVDQTGAPFDVVPESFVVSFCMAKKEEN